MKVIVPKYTRSDTARALEHVWRMTGLSKSELARRVGISPGTLTSYINGSRQPKDIYITRIARKCGVREEYLRTFTGPMMEDDTEDNDE